MVGGCILVNWRTLSKRADESNTRWVFTGWLTNIILRARGLGGRLDGERYLKGPAGHMVGG